MSTRLLEVPSLSSFTWIGKSTPFRGSHIQSITNLATLHDRNLLEANCPPMFCAASLTIPSCWKCYQCSQESLFWWGQTCSTQRAGLQSLRLTCMTRELHWSLWHLNTSKGQQTRHNWSVQRLSQEESYIWPTYFHAPYSLHKAHWLATQPRKTWTIAAPFACQNQPSLPRKQCWTSFRKIQVVHLCSWVANTGRGLCGEKASAAGCACQWLKISQTTPLVSSCALLASQLQYVFGKSPQQSCYLFSHIKKEKE